MFCLPDRSTANPLKSGRGSVLAFGKDDDMARLVAEEPTSGLVTARDLEDAVAACISLPTSCSEYARTEISCSSCRPSSNTTERFTWMRDEK